MAQTPPRHRPHDDVADAAIPAPATGIPPKRRSDWAEPEAEPILDAARVPLSAYPQSADGYLMYVWLHFVRPLLVVLF